MTINPQDRPLVTFALLAYNQERYIREAIVGALGQTYEPLEIILSDDGSSDRTFEIMQEMVANYDGPHELRLFRNQMNMGLLDHLFSRGRDARGEIIVVAAGDDISRPERTERLVSAFTKDTSLIALDSFVCIIDEAGNQLTHSIRRPSNLSAPDLFLTEPFEYLQGSSAAYRKEIFNICLPARTTDYPEDQLLSAYAAMLGRGIGHVREGLISYRQHGNAIANRPRRREDVRVAEERGRQGALKKLAYFDAIQQIAERLDREKLLAHDRIHERREEFYTIVDWPDMGFTDRLKSLLQSLIQFRSRHVKWKVARLFGRFPDYQPKKFFSRFQARHT